VEAQIPLPSRRRTSLLLVFGHVFQDVCRIKHEEPLPTQLMHLRGGGTENLSIGEFLGWMDVNASAN